ncbi:hypothetical protein RRG08_042324 [Elysia crispata]|uniref:Cytochrome c oxidase subunit n=1 Tax=Elysia crispata TaxID=231223 RepID=A0AAE0ZKM0_9GAST|nr:hypothetical protein RRG08_042324 [Elysia crispata]
MNQLFWRAEVGMQRLSRLPLRLERRRVSEDCKDPCKRQRFRGVPTEEVKAHGKATIWKYITIAASIPVLCQFFYLTFMANLHPEREEFVAWPHLRLRARAFPWGDGNHSFFHNKYYNALPDGYEEDD